MREFDHRIIVYLLLHSSVSTEGSSAQEHHLVIVALNEEQSYHLYLLRQKCLQHLLTTLMLN